MTIERVPSDGPDSVLFHMARRLRLRYSQAFVVQAISAHPNPGSLLALVEVANRMGTKTMPAKAEASGLSQVKLPAVVHFTGPDGEGGFGVLEAVSEGRVRVWDSVHGNRWLDRDGFLAHWSGVVVMMDRSGEPGEPEHRYLRQRLLEVLAGGTSTPAIADGRAAPYLRVAFACLLALLVGAALVATPSSQRVAAAVLVVLAIAGVAITATMGAVAGELEGALANRVCRRGKLVDCHGVLTSRYSRVFALPLSDIGLAFYGAVLLLVATLGWLDPSTVWRVSTLAFTVTLPFAALLVGVQVSMRQFCTLCMGTHLVNVSAAVIGWVWLFDGGLAGRDLLVAISLTLYLGLVLFIVIPYLRRSRSLAMLSERHRRVSASPFGTLAQILSEPPTSVEGSTSAVRVAGSAGAHEVVIYVHPGCGKCLPVLRQVLAVAQEVPINAWVGAAPRDPDEDDRRACALLVAAWTAVGPARITDAYSATKKHLRALSGPGGAAILAEELSIDAGVLESAVTFARPLVELAERAVDDHADGTPAVFFDSRPYTAPVAHLAFLIQNHPELLGTK